MATATSRQATINEIRIQRLSRTLQEMSSKSASTPRLNYPPVGRVTGVFLVLDNQFLDEENEPFESAGSKRGSLTRTLSSGTIETIRCRATSINRNQYRSLRINSHNSRKSSLEEPVGTGGGENSKPTDSGNSETSPMKTISTSVSKFESKANSPQLQLQKSIPDSPNPHRKVTIATSKFDSPADVRSPRMDLKKTKSVGRHFKMNHGRTERNDSNNNDEEESMEKPATKPDLSTSPPAMVLNRFVRQLIPGLDPSGGQKTEQHHNPAMRDLEHPCGQSTDQHRPTGHHKTDHQHQSSGHKVDPPGVHGTGQHQHPPEGPIVQKINHTNNHKTESQPAKIDPSHRSRTTTICGGKEKPSKSPSPTPRHRAETDGGNVKSPDMGKMRKLAHLSSTKSGSSPGISSRSLSPMPSLMNFASGGMLGSISPSDHPPSVALVGSPRGGNGVGVNSRSSSSTSSEAARHTVLIVGAKGVGKSSLIARFLKEDCRKGGASVYATGSGPDDNCVNLMVDNEESQLRFIEVNNQRSDLWLSLSGAAYVVMYNFDDTSSFRNANEVVARLQKRNDSFGKPIMLVSNKRVVDRKRFVIANDDGRQLAKEFHCKFYEIYVNAGRSCTDLLIGIVQEIRCHNVHRHADAHSHHSREEDSTQSSTSPPSFLPSFFEHANSVPTGLGHGQQQQFAANRTTSTPPTSASAATVTTAKTSSFSQKFWWPRKKVKECKSAEATEETSKMFKDTNLVDGMHDCLFGAERRGSKSLESLPLLIK